MRCAETHFRLKGYDVTDRSSKQPFDLKCRRGSEQVLLEVKGTTTPGDEVLLTKNEVALAQDSETVTVLLAFSTRSSWSKTVVVIGRAAGARRLSIHGDLRTNS